MWLVDLDAVPQLPRGLRWLARFDAADHVGDTGSWRANLDAFLAEQGVDLQGGRIVALTSARSGGYVFNPLTVYWCHDPADEVVAVVAEVHNTYGGRHCYLLRPDAAGRDCADKAFYVSPFFTVDGHYEMRCPEPGDMVDVSVTLHREDRPVFTARVAGKREDAGRSVLAAALRHPFTSYRVMALIRFEGLRLWSRRVPVVPRATAAQIVQEGVR
ncbi:MAG: DUF1365 domain-containing protein [Acidimicrobiia bacterium]